jgi:hypothetical protein
VTFPPFTLLEGLQGVRLRPHLFIGETTVGNLVSQVLRDIRHELPTVHCRLEVRGEGELALTLEPLSFPPDAERPYDPFLQLSHSPYCQAWVLINSMSERLDVRTTHGGARYACAFERGDLVVPFHRVDSDRTDADAVARLTTTLTFRPDRTIFGGG